MPMMTSQRPTGEQLETFTDEVSGRLETVLRTSDDPEALVTLTAVALALGMTPAEVLATLGTAPGTTTTTEENR